MNKIALVFGVGQSIAFYLVKFLLDKNYQVHGMTDDPQMFPEEYLKRLYNILPQEKHNFVLHYGQLSDTMGVMKLVKQTTPNEIYNLATSNHISGDDEGDEYGANINGLCALRVLDAVRLMGMDKRTRIYQASTSDIFGDVSAVPQTETTQVHPLSPFAVAKVYAYWITVNYRERITTCLHVTVFYLIMNLLFGENMMCLVKLLRGYLGLPWVSKKKFMWGTWMPIRIGAMYWIMCR